MCVCVLHWAKKISKCPSNICVAVFVWFLRGCLKYLWKLLHSFWWNVARWGLISCQSSSSLPGFWGIRAGHCSVSQWLICLIFRIGCFLAQKRLARFRKLYAGSLTVKVKWNPLFLPVSPSHLINVFFSFFKGSFIYVKGRFTERLRKLPWTDSLPNGYNHL